MRTYISIKTTPQRLPLLLEERYAGLSAWEAFRLRDYLVVGRHSMMMLQGPQLEFHLACRSMELMGMSCYYLGDFVLAASSLESVSCVYATHPVCQLFLAESLAENNRPGLGIDLLKSVRISSSENPELLMMVAGSFENLGISNEALQTVREACMKEPENGSYLMDLSYYLVRTMGVTPTSIGLAWKAVDLEPDIANHRVWLATLYCSIGETLKAFRSVKSLSKQELGSIECKCCLRRLLQLYANFGAIEQADWCRNFLNASDSTPILRNHRAESHLLPIHRIPATVEGVI